MERGDLVGLNIRDETDDLGLVLAYKGSMIDGERLYEVLWNDSTRNTERESLLSVVCEASHGEG